MRTDLIDEFERVINGALGDDLTEIGHGASQERFKGLTRIDSDLIIKVRL
jgi:hypothetical protein